MKFRDYYQILGVDRSASADEIKKHYRQLARKYHPDVSKEPDSDTRMKEVNEAYAVLSDNERRAAYDQLGHEYQPGQDFRAPPDWDAGFEFSGHGIPPENAADFSDFFGELFSHIGGARHRAGGPQAKGQDHHARIVIDLDDAWNGSTRQISLRVPQAGPDGRLMLVMRTLNVKIPQGVREGQLIRLGGQGAPGLSGGSAGDLYLEVHFHPHPRFHVEGRDLHLALPVAPWEAALGATIAIALPAGHQVKVRIPDGTQNGRELKVRGKGIPGDSPGDLYLSIEVVLPDASHPRARQIYETMQRELAFNPRAEWENTR